jgi:hypothetical protein
MQVLHFNDRYSLLSKNLVAWIPAAAPMPAEVTT